MGQNNDSTCSGIASTLNWSTALSTCNNLTLAGRTWRLPNIDELKSIVDRNIYPNPAAIDNTIFPATVAQYYWSSSTYVPDTAFAWSVPFVFGTVNTNFKADSYYVRCVSQ